MQVLQGCEQNVDFVSGQLHPANHALPVSQKLRHVSDQEPGLRHGRWHRDRVQLRLLTANGKNKQTSEPKRDF